MKIKEKWADIIEKCSPEDYFIFKFSSLVQIKTPLSRNRIMPCKLQTWEDGS